MPILPIRLFPSSPGPCYSSPVRNRRRISLVLAAGLLAIGGGAALLRHQVFRAEPTYQDKPLSYWVDDLREDQTSPAPREESMPDPRVAIRHIGAKAVPYLLKWIAYQTPPWRQRFDRFAAQHTFLSRFASQDMAEYERAEGAATALEILGPTARKAKPDLIRLYQQPSESQWAGWAGWWSVAARAGRALRTVAPEAIPAVLPGLRSKDPGHRLGAAWFMQTAGTNAVAALPDLLELMGDEDTQGQVSGAARTAAEELIKVGDAAVPYLEQAFKTGSPAAREWAAEALSRLRPAPVSQHPRGWHQLPPPPVPNP